MSVEQDSPQGPGTMQGLEQAPFSPYRDAKDKLERSGPPPRHGEKQQTLPPATWENHELPAGSPEAPAIDALVARDQGYAAEGAPARHGAAAAEAAARRYEAQGPPARTA